MPIARIEQEEELSTGWRFHVEMLDNDGQGGRCEATLSWADYDLWCPGGSMPPHAVIEAVVLFLLMRQSIEEIRATFDASIARRLFHDADTRIPGLIKRP